MQRGMIDDKFIRLFNHRKSRCHPACNVTLKLTLRTSSLVVQGDERRLVLIEGAPGSGKSTLALHICQEWAEGKLFQEYDVVILVKLRDPLTREAKTVADLLPCADEAIAKEAEIAMKAQFCRGVLWVLDGWDELPSDLPIIKKLIQPDMLRESPLHQSAVIITSRPDLLPRVNMAMVKEAETEMISLFGHGVLWVLDGWDELPPDLPTDSIIKN